MAPLLCMRGVAAHGTRRSRGRAGLDDWSFLTSDGRVARLLRAADWSRSPLGPPSAWPDLLRSILATILTSPQPMFISWGPDLTILHNDACEALLGLRAEGGPGRPFPELWPDLWDDIAPVVGKAYDGEGSSCEDVPLTVLRHGRPEETWWTFSCNPLRDARGAVRGMLCVAVESSARVLAERHARAERERFAALFERAPDFTATLDGSDHRFAQAGGAFRRPVGGREVLDRVAAVSQVATDVTDRVRAEAESQFRQSRRMEAIGQLTGGVAHDFNNLLTPIVGALEVLRRRALGGPREHRLIEGATQAAERARVLVSRLLAFARRQPLEVGPVDLAHLVEGLRHLVASTVGPQVRISVHVGSDLPPAVADANQIEMAILSLAANARDAMPRGGALTVSAAREEVDPGHPTGLPPGTFLRLRIEDTGHGMDEATLARAVEPFFSTKGTGAGLGLSMAHGLVLQLGGALGLESRPGRGTRVTLWLPAATRRGAARAALLVDEEPLVREATADMLAELGYRVTPAASTDEALRLVEGGLAPDLLVTDHLMPGMTGTDLALRLRGMRPELSVLIVSGFAEASGLSPDLPRLAKPFRRDELAASLERLRRA